MVVSIGALVTVRFWEVVRFWEGPLIDASMYTQHPGASVAKTVVIPGFNCTFYVVQTFEQNNDKQTSERL